MTNVLIALGIVLPLVGVLVSQLPENMWRGVTTRGSRWANQASTSGMLVFAGLGWIGVTLIVLYGNAVWLGWRSTQWVEEEGTVLESQLVETRLVRTTNFSYRPEVIYGFSVNGEAQRGTRVDAAGSSTLDRDFVEEELRTRYAPGAKVAVFVDPYDATRSVLVPGVPAKASTLVGLGAALLAVAAWQLRALFCDWEGDGLVASEPRRKKRGKRRWVFARSSSVARVSEAHRIILTQPFEKSDYDPAESLLCLVYRCGQLVRLVDGSEGSTGGCSLGRGRVVCGRVGGDARAGGGF